MQRLGFGAVLVALSVGACGSTTEEKSAASGSGASSTTGVGGSSATGTSSVGAGGIPEGCTSPVATACTGPGQCVLTSPECCLCGTPELADMVAINSQHTSECMCSGPACGCATFDNPNLAASCEAGKCAAWDVRQEDAYSACTTSADCRLRDGLGCCETCMPSSMTLIAVRSDAEAALKAAVCVPDQACDQCLPQYPPNAAAECLSGHCTVTLTN